MDAKTAIDQVLKDTGFSDVRPAKMGVDDLLKCVLSFNARPMTDYSSGYCMLSMRRAFILRNLWVYVYSLHFRLSNAFHLVWTSI